MWAWLVVFWVIVGVTYVVASVQVARCPSCEQPKDVTSKELLCADCRKFPCRVHQYEGCVAALCPSCGRTTQPLTKVRGLCFACTTDIAEEERRGGIEDLPLGTEDQALKAWGSGAELLLPCAETTKVKETQLQRYQRMLWTSGLRRSLQMTRLANLLENVAAPGSEYTHEQLLDVISNTGVLLNRYSETHLE